VSQEIKEMLYELGYSNIIENHKEYRARPIYRDSDNNTVLCINKRNGSFIDFARNIKGSFSDLVKLSLGLKNVTEAEEWIGKNGGLTAQPGANKPRLRAPKVYSKAVLSKLVPNHDYWTERGVSEYAVSEFRGGIVRDGKMANRYVFPIFNSQDGLVGFAGRDLFDNSNRPKWKLIGDKSGWRYPLFLNHKIIKDKKEVIVVESIGDMLALYDCNIKNVIVAFGIDISSSLLNLFIRYDLNRITISFNDDSKNNSAGNKAAEKAQRKVLKYFDPHQVDIALPTSGDFGEMSKDEILEWRGQLYG